MFFQSCRNEPPHDKINKMACVPSEDSDQPGLLPSLIRVFAVRMKKAWVLSYPLSAQRKLWSDWVDAQADLSLRWAHSHFVGFVMRRLKCCPSLWHFYLTWDKCQTQVLATSKSAAGWSKPLLFKYGTNRFSHYEAQMVSNLDLYYLP